MDTVGDHLKETWKEGEGVRGAKLSFYGLC